MSYANILVSVDLGEAAADRIRLAAGLAQRFEATLTGAAAEKVPAPVLVWPAPIRWPGFEVSASSVV